MEFKNPENHFAFKILILIILFSIVNIFFILNYFDTPKIDEDKSYIFGATNFNDPRVKNVDPDFWSISFTDKRFSSLENIIIYICMLWGFMKLIDLMFFLEKYKKD